MHSASRLHSKQVPALTHWQLLYFWRTSVNSNSAAAPTQAEKHRYLKHPAPPITTMSIKQGSRLPLVGIPPTKPIKPETAFAAVLTKRLRKRRPGLAAESLQVRAKQVFA